MIPAKFEYVRPGSVDEAVQALADGGEDAKVIAGGQSLMPLLRLRLAYPDLLVDVGGLDELRGVSEVVWGWSPRPSASPACLCMSASSACSRSSLLAKCW